jgi:AraC-like DNA-binding protein
MLPYSPKNVHNFLFLHLDLNAGSMNIYEITKRDLRDRNFAFKDETEFLGKDFENQYFIFDGLLFYICISGTAKIKINYKEYQVTADDMFIIPPKHICSIYGCSPGFKVRLILISLDFLCSMPVTPNFDLFQKADMHPHIHLDSVQLDNMLKLHSVITHYDSDNELSRQIQDTLIHAAILMTVSMFGQPDSGQDRAYSRQEIITRSFFKLLIKSEGMERKVSSYADKLCITPKYLTTAVKSVTNHPVQSWINEVALVEARRYLRTTDLTIQQISDRLRFQTASSFVRFFRTHTGQTPLDYRKTNEK